MDEATAVVVTDTSKKNMNFIIEWFLNLSDNWQLAILVIITILLTSLILYVGCKIDSYIFWHSKPKRRKRR